ncbi:hypothetical protein HDU76_001027 [Blyttiomyces sp. JEL0837]|nr:hypothetical protein HDU76_001027 [Blyttiomyces sp. JEL0837]
MNSNPGIKIQRRESATTSTSSFKEFENNNDGNNGNTEELDGIKRNDESGFFCPSCGWVYNGDHNDYVGAHNSIRGLYNLPPMYWCQNLAVHAQASADKIARNECGRLSHDKGNLVQYGEGENLFLSSGIEMTPFWAVNAWNGEAHDYFRLSNGGVDRNAAVNNREGVQVLHFTQLIWAGTQFVGCASSTCFDGREDIYVVSCRYTGPGNVFNSDGLMDPFYSQPWSEGEC